MSAESSNRPLAERMRPLTLTEFIGQAHLLGHNQALRLVIEQGKLHSMVFWGPPGVGKTTLARLIANYCAAPFLSLSAVLSGVKEIRNAIAQAEQHTTGTAPIVFVDEVHRFNKSQQDAFLPFIEDGTICLIGATTENPSFELNNALLSRLQVYVLKSLSETDLQQLIQRALQDTERGLGKFKLTVQEAAIAYLAQVADGDARQALNILEVAAESAIATATASITLEQMQQISRDGVRRFDKQGDIFYEQISALHKSVRGSDPDAALYWYCRMLDGGCDPLYVARRVVRMATEDIGNADPRGLTLALQAWDAYTRLGSPEGELVIAQAIVYLACAAKSNAVYTAFNAAMHEAKNSGSLAVPMHLRNAPTQLLKSMGYGKSYRYDHDEPEGVARQQQYFPTKLGQPVYYQPVNRGLEIQIAEKLTALRRSRKSSVSG